MAQTSIGKRQIGRILDLLAKETLSSIELSARLHMCVTSVTRFINRLLAEKPRRLYIAAWRDGLHNKPVRLFAAGAKKDVRYVTARERKPRPARLVEADRRRVEVLALLAMPQTSYQLAARMEMSVSRVTAILREQRTARCVHIKAWILPIEKGSQSPVYALGNLPDKPRTRRSRERAPKGRPAVWAPALSALYGSPP